MPVRHLLHGFFMPALCFPPVREGTYSAMNPMSQSRYREYMAAMLTRLGLFSDDDYESETCVIHSSCSEVDEYAGGEIIYPGIFCYASVFITLEVKTAKLRIDWQCRKYVPDTRSSRKPEFTINSSIRLCTYIIGEEPDEITNPTFAQIETFILNHIKK